MDDKLKETLYIAYTEAYDAVGKLLDATQDYKFNRESQMKLSELRDASVASKTLYAVIKQAGMLEDYLIWLMRRSAANED